MKKTAAFGIVLAFFLSALGCAGRQPLVRVAPEAGKAFVEIKVESFSFEPNNLETPRGTTIVFRLENASDSGHNFSIKDPGGKVLKSVDLPAGKSVTVEVSFTEAGEYTFHCDKPFHASFGMIGRVEVF